MEVVNIVYWPDGPEIMELGDAAAEVRKSYPGDMEAVAIHVHSVTTGNTEYRIFEYVKPALGESL